MGVKIRFLVPLRLKMNYTILLLDTHYSVLKKVPGAGLEPARYR